MSCGSSSRWLARSSQPSLVDWPGTGAQQLLGAGVGAQRAQLQYHGLAAGPGDPDLAEQGRAAELPAHAGAEQEHRQAEHGQAGQRTEDVDGPFGGQPGPAGPGWPGGRPVRAG